MDHPIKNDHERFKKIIKGKVRKNLKKYVSGREVVVPNKNGQYRIPMPEVETPRFRFGEQSQGGIGHGDGDPGTPLDEGSLKKGGDESSKKASGNEEGRKELEVVMTEIELAKILGEELELPNIKLKGKRRIENQSKRYTHIGTTGPDSLKHFKRTYKNALKRQIITGSYDPNDPMIVPIREDFRYRNTKVKVEYENSAVVIYMMDVSGSMGDEQKEIVRTESFWINLWLKSQYKDIEVRYLIHDASAKEVDEETFF